MQQKRTGIVKEKIALFRRELRRLEREVLANLQDDTRCCGVTLAQCHVLLEIADAGEITVSELAARLHLDKSTLSRTVESLHRLGLVKRTPNSKNRRSLFVFLSAPGQRFCQDINQRCNRYYQRVLQAIPQRKIAKVLAAVSLLSDAFTVNSRTNSSAVNKAFCLDKKNCR